MGYYVVYHSKALHNWYVYVTIFWLFFDNRGVAPADYPELVLLNSTTAILSWNLTQAQSNRNQDELEHVPIKRKRVRTKDVPYMTKKWKNAIRVKRKAAKQFAKEKNSRKLGNKEKN